VLINVYDESFEHGRRRGRQVELSDAIFGVEPNEAVVHEVVKNHLANCRQGTQSALTRAEVSGGGKKPWKQKGTGHARQGSTRAPQWTHGGIVFAPKPRDYGYVLNKKVKRLALKSVLSAKAAEGSIDRRRLHQDGRRQDKGFRKFLTAVKADGKSVVVTPAKDENVVKSARNIPGVITTTADGPERLRHSQRQVRWCSTRPRWQKSRRCSRNELPHTTLSSAPIITERSMSFTEGKKIRL
jgi:large subunit ribosomal protein L4